MILGSDLTSNHGCSFILLQFHINAYIRKLLHTLSLRKDNLNYLCTPLIGNSILNYPIKQQHAMLPNFNRFLSCLQYPFLSIPKKSRCTGVNICKSFKALKKTKSYCIKTLAINP